MSPSEISWDLFLVFLGWLLNAVSKYLQNCRTNRGTSDVELSGIRVENEIATTPFHDAQSSGGDEEARPPSSLSNPFGAAMVFPESGNDISLPDSSSTWMASPTAGLRQHIVPSPSGEVHLVDHVQARTFHDLRRRPMRSKEIRDIIVPAHMSIRYSSMMATWHSFVKGTLD